MAEAQAANAKLAQKTARPPAELAAVMLARGEDPSPFANARFAVYCTRGSTFGARLIRPLRVFRALMQPNAILYPFCCSRHSNPLLKP
jgi:hypothetical protein